MRHYIEDHKRGAFEFGAPTDHVLEVTGRAPEDFETIARRYAALPEARRTLGNGLRALGDFMRIGLTPAYNLGRYEREQQHPFPVHPQLAANSSIWREEHGDEAPFRRRSTRTCGGVMSAALSLAGTAKQSGQSCAAACRNRSATARDGLGGFGLRAGGAGIRHRSSHHHPLRCPGNPGRPVVPDARSFHRWAMRHAPGAKW